MNAVVLLAETTYEITVYSNPWVKILYDLKVVQLDHWEQNDLVVNHFQVIYSQIIALSS